MSNENDILDEDYSFYLHLEDMTGSARGDHTRLEIIKAINEAVAPFGYKIKARMDSFEILEKYTEGMKKTININKIIAKYFGEI